MSYDADLHEKAVACHFRKPKTLALRSESPLGKLTDRINAEHRACHEAADSALDHALSAGALLVEAKSLCPHGQWQQWVRDYFEGSPRLASSYMRLASNRELVEAKRQTSADLSIDKALRHLAPTKRETQPALSAVERRKRVAKVVAENCSHKLIADEPDEDARLDLEVKSDRWAQLPWFDVSDGPEVSLVSAAHAVEYLRQALHHAGLTGEYAAVLALIVADVDAALVEHGIANPMEAAS